MSVLARALPKRSEDADVRLAVRRGAWVLLAVIIAQAAWILAAPPFRGIDEFDHAFRAAG
ncbi:MAG: hypothetical protein QOH37_3615, partial [Nocardioidaceae bacterium]|nr:hypothetical protein [Nocardioidaceae bacterium]